jgi:hypothetical protein
MSQEAACCIEAGSHDPWNCHPYDRLCQKCQHIVDAHMDAPAREHGAPDQNDR